MIQRAVTIVTGKKLFFHTGITIAKDIGNLDKA